MTEGAALTPDWLGDAGLVRLLDVLGHEHARLVGGCVRDGLLCIAVSDIDIATLHQPDVTTELASAAGMKVVPTGIAHGTVTVISGGKAFEVTTLREDVETDGRHAKVAFTDDWQADAARRDFTMNALYADAQGRVYDYFGGLADLDRRCVRFIGDANLRIEEDALRILRFYRFSARYSDTLNAPGRAACTHWAKALTSLSRERIQAEWFKLLNAPEPAATLLAMRDDGVLGAFLPEADLSCFAAMVRSEQALGLSPSVLRRFAGLLPEDKKVVEGIARRLKCSNAQREGLVARVQRVTQNDDPKVLLYRYGEALATDLALLSALPKAALGALMQVAKTWAVPTFPVSGQDLMSQTSLRGPDLGRALYQLQETWIESGFSLDKPQLIEAAKAL